MNIELRKVCISSKGQLIQQGPILSILYPSTQHRAQHMEIAQWMFVGWMKKRTKKMKTLPLCLAMELNLKEA